MKPRSALVLCGGDAARDPRPHRAIRCLATEYQVTVLARGPSGLPGVRDLAIPPYPDVPFSQKLLGVVRQRLGRRRPTIWPPGLRQLAAGLRSERFDVIVVHTLELLPVALAIGGGRSRVIFDAREYYPRQGEERWWWRTMFQPVATSLCREYLSRATTVLTVSPGLVAEYQREFGVACHLVPSLPQSVPDLAPSPLAPGRVRLIHHGHSARARQLERMIDLMRLLPPSFSLDFMLVETDHAYAAELRCRAEGLPSVTFRPPVALGDLVRASHGYDIGLYLLPPTSFNTLHALPNKFFEFVQSRLMLAIGPSPDMADYLRRYDLGVVADDFSAEAMARALRALTPEGIARHKQGAHLAATTLHAGRTDAMLLALARGEVPPPAP